jgi:very-short-patch-repair endonuclease
MRHRRLTRESRRQQVLEGRAAFMRGQPTASEARLFEAVRGGRLGVAFRRQVPLLGRYIADLLVLSLKLVVEVDGGYHEERQAADQKRDRALAGAGYRVVRVPVELVMGDLQAAVAIIAASIEACR